MISQNKPVLKSYLIYLGGRTCVDLNKVTGVCPCNDPNNVKIYYTVGDKEESLQITANNFDTYFLPYVNNITNNTK